MTAAGDERWLRAEFHPLTQPPAGPEWNLAELVDLLPARLAHAAVLVGVVDRPGGETLILTRRDDSMRQHAGQIAFPGGRLDQADRGPVEAAMRETHEEVGIESARIRPLGFLDPYATITGFRVTPVVARVDAGYVARPQPGEVAEVFEVPLAFLLDPDNCQKVEAEFRGRIRHYWQFQFDRHRIWGATAAMILNLRRFLVPPP